MTTNVFSVDIGVQIDIANTYINSTTIAIDSVFNVNNEVVIFGNSIANVVISSNPPTIVVANSTSNNYITSNSVPNAGKVPKISFFTSNGTFVPDPTTNYTKITIVGGGGGAAATANGTSTTMAYSTGAYSGASAIIYANGSLISNQDVIVGLGGSGANGTNSMFGNLTTYVSVLGGALGLNCAVGSTLTIGSSSTYNGNVGGTNSANYPHTIFIFRPGAPTHGIRLDGNTGIGGIGGSSLLFGGSGDCGFSTGFSENAMGKDGKNWGAGGGGSVSLGTSPGAATNGANGVVIVEEYF